VVKQVAVIGGGYVGLTTGVALAYLGHRVTVVALGLMLRVMGAFAAEALKPKEGSSLQGV